MELKIGMPFEKNLAISNKIKNKQTFSSQQFHSQAYAPETLLLGGGGVSHRDLYAMFFILLFTKAKY